MYFRVIFTVTWIILCLSMPALAENSYIGSEQCAKCHEEIYAGWVNGGHHKQLRSVSGKPLPELELPQGYTWDDIAYVVGGVKVKAHFVDQDGYLITSAKDGSKTATEYNLTGGKWTDFHPGEKKPYDCASCHTTGYSSEGHQGGKPGIVGTWQEDGIGCEACHGPGLRHSKSPDIRTIKKARSQALCGRCHQRGGITQKPLKDIGLVRHHEQINELKAGAHKGLTCLNCHKPHTTAKGTTYNCIICHSRAYNGYEQSVHGQAQIKCIECHMARIPRSAISRVSYIGRVRSHLFRIGIDADTDMFKKVKDKDKESLFTKGFIAVEFACLQCHKEQGRKWAISHSKNFHQRHKAD